LGVIGVILALPLMLLVALAVKLFSKDQCSMQTRAGKYGVPFTLYKFRSMYTDAEAAAARLGHSEDPAYSHRPLAAASCA
jgi:lipopolysaccharide/colanic/teichoic acid biosynthesis glycosyltransferase